MFRLFAAFLNVSEVLPDFNAKKMDILWGCSHLGDEQLVCKKIDETHHVLCASPHYIKRKGMPHSISELLQHDIIGHSARKPPYFILFKNNQKLIVEPILWVNSSEAMIQAALEYIGIFWTHKYLVKKLVVQKKLTYVLPNEMEQLKAVHAFYEFKPYQDLKIKAFIDFFTQ
jgi:LysR family transcriptional regulator for bpeEF and oprC